MRKRRETRKNVGSEAEFRHEHPSVPTEAARSVSLSCVLPLLALGTLLLLLLSYQLFRDPKTISSLITHLSVYERGLVKLKPNVGYQEVLNKLKRIQRHREMFLIDTSNIQFWLMSLHGIPKDMIWRRNLIQNLRMSHLCGMS